VLWGRQPPHPSPPRIGGIGGIGAQRLKSLQWLNVRRLLKAVGILITAQDPWDNLSKSADVCLINRHRCDNGCDFPCRLRRRNGPGEK
jgi:hypothetical protein